MKDRKTEGHTMITSGVLVFFMLVVLNGFFRQTPELQYHLTVGVFTFVGVFLIFGGLIGVSDTVNRRVREIVK